MTTKYLITLGTCGPTDCSLCLTAYFPIEDVASSTVEYGIESLGWKILSHYWSITNRNPEEIPEWLGKILVEGDET